MNSNCVEKSPGTSYKSILLPKIVLTFQLLLELIVLVISKFLQILGLQPRISFSQTLEQFFLTVCQNNFGNKIPLPLKKAMEFSENNTLHRTVRGSQSAFIQYLYCSAITLLSNLIEFIENATLLFPKIQIFFYRSRNQWNLVKTTGCTEL